MTVMIIYNKEMIKNKTINKKKWLKLHHKHKRLYNNLNNKVTVYLKWVQNIKELKVINKLIV